MPPDMKHFHFPLTFLLSSAFLCFSSRSWAVSLPLCLVFTTCNFLGTGFSGCLSWSKATVKATLRLLLELSGPGLPFFAWWVFAKLSVFFEKLLFSSSMVKSLLIWEVNVLKSLATCLAVASSSEDVIWGLLWLESLGAPAIDLCWSMISTLCASFLAASCRSWILFSLCSTSCCLNNDWH